MTLTNSRIHNSITHHKTHRSSKSSRLRWKRQTQLEILSRLEGMPIEELVWPSPDDPFIETVGQHVHPEWLILLNACFSSGFTGPKLHQFFASQYPGEYDCVEMFLGCKPYTYVHFHTFDGAKRAFMELNEKSIPKFNKILLVAFARTLPEFPIKPLTKPSVIVEQIPGLLVTPDFISQCEETELLEHVHNDPELQTRWQTLNHRRIVHYGFKFDYSIKAVDTSGIVQDVLASQDLQDTHSLFPSWIRFAVTKYEQLYPDAPTVEQLTLNYYTPGGGIPPHVDRHSSFVGPIVILSVGGDIVMEFRLCIDPERKDNDESNYIVKEVVLPARSLVVLTEEARYGWEHTIRPRKIDLVHGQAVERIPRLSFTFRTVKKDDSPCPCNFKYLCD